MSNLVKLFLLIYCVVAVQSFARHVVLGGAASIPAAFTAGATESELLVCPQGQNKFRIWNGTTTALEWGLGAGAGVVPAAISGTIPASSVVDFEGYVTFNGVKPVFIRALGSSAITSGYITMMCPGMN